MAHRYPNTGMTAGEIGAFWAFVGVAAVVLGMLFKLGWDVMKALIGS